MLRLHPLILNLILSLYIFILNSFSMLSILGKKADSSADFLSFSLIYFALIHLVISILCVFRATAYVFAVLLIFSSAFAVYFISEYSVMIDDTLILSLFATDLREAGDFISLYFVIFIALSLVLPLVLLAFVRVKKGFFKQKILVIFINILLLLGLIFMSSKTLIPFLRANDAVRFYNVPFYQFYATFKLAKEHFGAKKELLKICSDAKIADDGRSKTFILVVGETARAANYSLKGYDKNDTNFYTKDFNVHFFNQFSSCGTATAQSLPCMFSINKRTKFDKNENIENVLSVLNRFIDVHWLDNNSGGCKGVCNGIKSIIKSEDYDGWLIDAAEQLLKQKSSKNTLIVLHLQGSHGPSYYLRYPAEFERFTPTCKTNKLQNCSSESLFNTYDNTLLYTDYILSELIKLLKADNAEQRALFYLSDHGESLGENGFYLHGMPYYLAPKEQINIPAILWLSDEFINRDKLGYKLSQDNLFSSLLGFFNITTSAYEADYDIFNPHLKNNKN